MDKKSQKKVLKWTIILQTSHALKLRKMKYLNEAILFFSHLSPHVASIDGLLMGEANPLPFHGNVTVNSGKATSEIGIWYCLQTLLQKYCSNSTAYECCSSTAPIDLSCCYYVIRSECSDPGNVTVLFTRDIPRGMSGDAIPLMGHPFLPFI